MQWMLPVSYWSEDLAVDRWVLTSVCGGGKSLPACLLTAEEITAEYFLFHTYMPSCVTEQ